MKINLSELSATSLNKSIRIENLTAQSQNINELINQSVETAESHTEL